MVGLGQRSSCLSHRVSFQVELVGAVHEAIEDGVGQGRLSDDIMPFFKGELTGRDG